MAIFQVAIGFRGGQSISAGFAGGGAPHLRTNYFRERGGAMAIFQVAIGSFTFMDLMVSFIFLGGALVIF